MSFCESRGMCKYFKRALFHYIFFKIGHMLKKYFQKSSVHSGCHIDGFIVFGNWIISYILESLNTLGKYIFYIGV